MAIIIGVYGIIALIVVFFHSYEKEFVSMLNKKEHPFIWFYPVGLAISKQVIPPNSEQERKQKEQLRVLYVSEDIELKYKIFQAKKFATFFVVVLLCNTLALCIGLSERGIGQILEGNYINRPSYGEPSKNVGVHVAIEQDGQFIEQDMELEIAARKYTQETFNQEVERAVSYLEQAILGENTTLEEVCFPLYLVESVPKTDLAVKWQLDEEGIVNWDGTLNEKKITGEHSVLIKAILTSEDYEAIHSIPLIVSPGAMTKGEQLWKQLEDSLTDQGMKSKTESVFSLPNEIEDGTIYFEEIRTNSMLLFLGIGVVAGILLVALYGQQLVKQKGERELEIMLDYPELVSKVSMLLSAGMTLQKVWQKLCQEYQLKKERTGESRYAYEEMLVTWNEIQNGRSEVRAYEDFGRRMKNLKYMKLATLLTQNITKGAEGLTASLEYEALDAFENRKELAKQLGEKASTKLLGPMMLMLIIIIMMILIPAVMTL